MILSKKNIFVLLFCCTLSLSAQESLTRIAVIDYNKVLLSNNSQALSLLQAETAKYQKQIDKYTADINQLEQQRQQYITDGEKYKLSRVEKDILKKTQQRQEYAQQSQQKIKDKTNSISASSQQDLGVVLNAITYVAQSKGFSLVLKSNDSSLLWWDFSVDITDDVIAYLQR